MSSGHVRNYSLPVASFVPYPELSPRLDDSRGPNLGKEREGRKEEEEEGEERGGEYGEIVQEDQPEEVQEVHAGYILSPAMSGAQSSAVCSGTAWISTAEEDCIEDVVLRPMPRLEKERWCEDFSRCCPSARC